MAHSTAPSGPKSNTDRIEETTIAAILGIMTVITFANVVARYMFNTGILWALEVTVFLFAWLVLLGASYAVKIRAHLGVDAVINMVSPAVQRTFGLITVVGCLLYALIILKGSWDYWAPYANLPPFEGRVIPMGFDWDFRPRAWYETQDIPVPFLNEFLSNLLNEGELYEKMPKTIPYLVMPLSMGLLVYRFLQAGLAIYRGETSAIIASHEAEEAVAEANAAIKAEEK